MSEEVSSKSKIIPKLRIIVPILIICAIVGIWIIKNSEKNVEAEGNGNPDFALHVKEAIDFEKLKSYGIPIIIDFGADTCAPCKEMAPVLKELNEELQGKVIVKFVDVWKYQGLADDYPVSLIPTQFFFDANGKPYNPQDPDAMQMNLYSLKDTGEHVLTSHEGGMTKAQILKVLKEMGFE